MFSGSSLAQDRQSRNAGRSVPIGGFQGGLTEEQALQRALQLSTAEQPDRQDRYDMAAVATDVDA